MTGFLALLCRVLPWLVAGLPVVAQAADASPGPPRGKQAPAAGSDVQRDLTLCDRGRRQSPIDIVGTRRQAQPQLPFQDRSAPLGSLLNPDARERFATALSRALSPAKTGSFYFSHVVTPKPGPFSGDMLCPESGGNGVASKSYCASRRQQP